MILFVISFTILFASNPMVDGIGAIASLSLSNSSTVLAQNQSFNYWPSPLAQSPDVLTLNQTTSGYSISEILSDKDNRIAEYFDIPEALKGRVEFWFRIYTEYDSDLHVIHDMDDPSIIYEVVDTKPILQRTDLHRWTKYHRAKAHLEKRKKHYINTLNSINKKKFKKLNEEELRVFKLHKGNKKSLRQAASHLRSQTGQMDHFVAGLERSFSHLPKMELIFEKMGLPYELSRLCLVESSFNSKAHSKVGAKGIWQIMPSIAKKFNMIKGKKDLREDIYASTVVAAKLLKEKHRSLKAWPLAVTAYNHGPSGVKKAAKAVRSNKIEDILEEYESKRFGFASQNFYVSFLAALYAERYQDILFKETNYLQSSLVERPKNYN